jgi:small subunit ribosomal protein S20
MANTKSAEKRNKQALARRDRNRQLTSRLRTAVKKLRQAVESGNQSAAQELLASTLSTVDATATKGVIHKNAANRTKSRLQKAFNGMT